MSYMADIGRQRKRESEDEEEGRSHREKRAARQ
jgi:hypothetical protein